MKLKRALFLAAAAAMLAPGVAIAAPSQVSGFSQANVVIPAAVVPLTSLRFGQFIRPTAAGTVVISAAGAASATGGLTSNIGIAQVGTGRGAGSFSLAGTANRFILVALPASMTITSGAQSMTVNAFTNNTVIFGLAQLDATGHFILRVGATLNVAANQTVGNYTGTYNVTVTYF